MNTETTLAIIAIVAAFGLLTTIMVVEPFMQEAYAQGRSENKFRACDSQGAVEGRIPHC